MKIFLNAAADGKTLRKAAAAIQALRKAAAAGQTLRLWQQPALVGGEWWLLFQHTQQQSRGKCYHTVLQLSAVWVYHCYWHSNCRTHTLLFKKVSLFSFIFTCNQHSAAASRSTIKVHICSSLIKLKSNWIMKNYDVTYFDYVFHFFVIISVVFNNIALVLLMNFTAGYHHTQC